MRRVHLGEAGSVPLLLGDGGQDAISDPRRHEPAREPAVRLRIGRQRQEPSRVTADGPVDCRARDEGHAGLELVELVGGTGIEPVTSSVSGKPRPSLGVVH
jgi:hypothetical protein